MDFLPSSITSAGISSYFVSVTNVPTYFVTAVSFGNWPEARGRAACDCGNMVAPIAPRDFLPKSRRRIDHRHWRKLRLNFIDTHLSLLVPVMRDGEIITIQLRNQDGGLGSKASGHSAEQ